MNVTPPSAARSRTDLDAGSSICRPNVMVPRQRRETLRPVRPRRLCCMATPRTTSLSRRRPPPRRMEPVVEMGVADEEIETDSRTARGEDAVCSRDDLDAVEDVAVDGRPDHITVLDA